MAEVIDLRTATIDISKVDPEKINLGTDMQDCAIIARTYERAAHATPTEAAVFATLNRQLENNLSFSKAAEIAMSGYLRSPEDSAKAFTTQATTLSAEAGISPGASSGGASSQLDTFLQGLKLGSTDTSTLGSTFGNTMMDAIKNCIPCGLRLEAFLELNPSADLLSALEMDLKNKLDSLMSVIDLLKNISSYQNICDLIDMLSFMCPADLQKLIVALMALFLLDVPELDGLIDILAQLIAPIFAPIFVAITSLLDQFISLVTNPLECVVDAFEQQISALNFEISVDGSKIKVQTGGKDAVEDIKEELKEMRKEMNDFSSGVKDSLSQLTELIQEAISTLKARLDFYIAEIKAMMAEFGLGDGSYLRLSLRKLNIVRFISFIVAIVTALATGDAVCSENKTPTNSQIDSFFNNFLNPNSAFNMWVGDDGEIHVDEKTLGTDTAILSNSGNVFQFEGDDLLDSSVLQTTENIRKALAEPIQIVTPCRFNTSASEADKVVQWIAELNQS